MLADPLDRGVPIGEYFKPLVKLGGSFAHICEDVEFFKQLKVAKRDCCRKGVSRKRMTVIQRHFAEVGTEERVVHAS